MTDCIFCKIVKKEIPAREVYRDSEIVAFHDISPKAPVHLLVIPAKHTENLMFVEESDREMLGKLMLTAKKIAEENGLNQNGYKLAANNGAGAGQLVFHLHFHILGGWKQKPDWAV